MSHQQPPLVVHIIFALGTGGLENGLVNIINRADPGRYRHAIVCLSTADEFAGRLTAPGVEVYTLNKKEGQDWTLFPRLWRLLRRLRPAVIHTRNLAALEMQVLGLVMPGVRQVHGEHGRDIYDLDGSNRKYQLLRKLLSPVIDRFITVSEDLREWLVDVVGISKDKVVQIYNGVDVLRFAPRGPGRPLLAPQGFLDEESILIGTVGRMAEVKDQKSLLVAFARMITSKPALRQSLRLVLVGNGPLFESLHRQVVDLGLEGEVWMPGDRSDVPELLTMLDIFVLPSLAEGISNTILEAMATGLPVVATDTGGNPELIRDGENGYLVPVGDPAALAAKLEQMIEEPEKMRILGARARLIIDQQFDWDRTVEHYLSIYDEILSAG